VFAFWNAEEQGLFGSRHFVSHVIPTGSRVVANLNLDMVGRREEVPSGNDPRFRGLRQRPALVTQRLIHILGYSFSPDLAGVVREEAPHLELAVEAAYDSHPIDLLRRSDHWPFLLAGVPALFLTTGLHPDYHTPQDDVDRIDFEKLARVARLAFRVAWRVAEADSLPRMTGSPAAEE
jgi:Zn-dependent M28 family amino/carboxypeptidase